MGAHLPLTSVYIRGLPLDKRKYDATPRATIAGNPYRKPASQPGKGGLNNIPGSALERRVRYDSYHGYPWVLLGYPGSVRVGGSHRIASEYLPSNNQRAVCDIITLIESIPGEKRLGLTVSTSSYQEQYSSVGYGLRSFL